jgi:hypothetical protein
MSTVTEVTPAGGVHVPELSIVTTVDVWRSAIFCVAQSLVLLSPVAAAMLPVFPAANCDISNAAIDGPNAAFEALYFVVMLVVVGALKYPLPLVVPTSVANSAMTSSFEALVVTAVVVAILLRPVFVEATSIGLLVSTPLYPVMPPSALV